MLDELLARFQFWRAKKLEVGIDYDFFFDMSNKEAIAIKLLREYPGVIVEFTNIHMSSDTHVSYDQTIIANPNLCRTETEKFKNFTTAIFRSIINNAVESALKESNENRNSNLVQSDSERTVHEEVVTVSEERVSNRKPRKKTVRRNKAVHSEVQQSAANSSIGDQPKGVDKTN